jgi:RNA polymerase sigma factor (sigma-70 family)
MGSRHPEVDDAVQLALLGFVQALPSFRGECDPAQFAARIAVRVARRLRQSAKARSKPTDRSVELDDLQGQPESQAGATPSAAFRDLFDGLREEQSEVLVLRIMLGWDLREIAEAGGDRRLPRRIDRARRDRRAE